MKSCFVASEVNHLKLSVREREGGFVCVSERKRERERGRQPTQKPVTAKTQFSILFPNKLKK